MADVGQLSLSALARSAGRGDELCRRLEADDENGAFLAIF